MRLFNPTIFIAIAVTFFNLISCNTTSKPDEQEKTLTGKENDALKKTNDSLQQKQALDQKKVTLTTDTAGTNSLDFLKTLHGKYPNEVKLFDNPVLTERLKKLLGNSRYHFLVETWAVETPMEFSNNIFVASGCQAHNCSSTNFIIVVDFSTDKMYAGIREEDKVKTYSEDGTLSKKVTDWAEGN